MQSIVLRSFQKWLPDFILSQGRLLVPNIIIWILLEFNRWVDWRFWFIHLCRVMDFEYLVELNRIAFMVSCLKSAMKHSLTSRKLVQAVQALDPLLAFHRRISLTLSGSFSLWNFAHQKCRDLSQERKPKGKANSHHGTRSKATYFWSPSYPSAKKLCASVFLTSRVACEWLPLP